MNPWLRGFFPTLTGGGECCYNRNSAFLVYFVEFGKRGKNSDFFFLIIKLNYPLKNEAPPPPNFTLSMESKTPRQCTGKYLTTDFMQVGEALTHL